MQSPSKKTGDTSLQGERLHAEVERQYQAQCMRTDRYFAILMLLQWIAAISIALMVSPRTWAGDVSSIHPHLLLAFFYGGVLTLLPVALSRIAPGERVTRLTIAATQMLMSSLLIHLTGGRIETHFHVFGSLAFLAYYLDWQVLVVASSVIAMDHLARMIYLPFSVFGSYTAQPWRWLEHVGWVLFCDVFLIIVCSDRLRSLRELSAQHVSRGDLLHKAYHDVLTGLPNRTSLSEAMSAAMQAADVERTGFGCLYIDLDQFKAVNDTFGHAVGDELLRSVTERMQSNLGPGVLLARVGGDEFVALVSHEPDQHDQVQRVARRLLRCLLLPFALSDREVAIGASIGVSNYPEDGRDEAELLMKSDTAMYRVKRTGRKGYLVYAPALFPEAGEPGEPERRLQQAIDDGELHVHYQPLINNSGAITRFEALVRWLDPVRGSIFPDEFIPLAEETGLIVPLGAFVLREACRQSAEWRKQNSFVGVIAVNVSGLQLAKEDFADFVIRSLDEFGNPAESIELEITESALFGDFDLTRRHLTQLRDHGIRMSIDDFGTGYSSLNRLRQLKLDSLKIDRLFIESIATSQPDRLLVQHIIGMGHSLGMSVIAEGVETEAQLDVLRSLGCDHLQGFLLGRPLDSSGTEQLLLAKETQAFAEHPDKEKALQPARDHQTSSVTAALSQSSLHTLEAGEGGRKEQNARA